MADPKQYVAMVSERLRADGFQVTPNDSDDARMPSFWAERRDDQAGPFSTVATFLAVRLDASIDAAQLTAFSAACFQAAIARTGGGRGLGSSGVCFAVSATSQVDPEVVATVERTLPTKHLSSFEFPVLVDLGANTVTFYRQRVLWGAAYVRAFRRDADRWLQPGT
jgi:hypothetical protein